MNKFIQFVLCRQYYAENRKKQKESDWIIEYNFSSHCDKCGLCCKDISAFEEMKEYNRGDNTCKFLDKNNMCQIYENRPNLCNGGWVYKNIYAKKYSEEEFTQYIKEMCEKIKRKGE